MLLVIICNNQPYLLCEISTLVFTELAEIIQNILTKNFLNYEIVIIIIFIIVISHYICCIIIIIISFFT